jgi:catecholate siderophore receptor
MGPRRIWKAWRTLRARQNLVGGTVGMSFLVAASAALGQTPGQSTDQTTGQAPGPEPEAIALPGVQVGAQRARSYLPSNPGLFRLTDNYLDIPQSMTIVTQDLMREQAAFNLRDSLRNVTGISLQAGEGGGGQGDNLSLRGFSARTDIFLDGIRDTGQYNRDVFNLEAVEVLKGPSAVYFGRGSTGGVINQVSKTPQKERFYDGTLSGGNGPLGRGTVDLNQPFGDSMAIRLNALAQYSEPVGRDDVDFLRFGVAPSFAWGVGTPTLFTASYYYYQENNQPDRGIPIVTFPGQIGGPPDVDPSNYYGLVQQDEEKVHLNRATLTFDHKFNESIAVHNIFRYQYSDRLSKVTPGGILAPLMPGQPLSSIVVTRNRAGRDENESILANQSEALFKFDTWMLKHKLVAGIDVARQTYDRQTLTLTPGPNTSLTDPDPFPPGIYTTTNGVRFEAHATSVGAYVVDDVQLLSWLKLVAGARYDNFDSEVENFNADRTLATKFSRVDQFWSPRAALVVQPTSSQTYYFAWGRSFNPSAEQLNSINVANQGVEPEQTNSYELGAKLAFFNNALGVTGALFRIDKSNARTVDPITGVATLDGNVRSQGLELGIIGRPVPEWNIFFGYTFLNTEIIQGFEVGTQGKNLANAPDHALSLWTTYDFLQKWQAGTGIFYSSSRFGNNANTSQVPGYVRWDLTGAYQVNKNVGVRLNIQNVMDTTYFDQVHPGHVIPGDGRTFILSGNFTF